MLQALLSGFLDTALLARRWAAPRTCLLTWAHASSAAARIVRTLHDSETTTTGWTVDVQEAIVVMNSQAAKVVFLLALAAGLSKVRDTDINAHEQGSSRATHWSLGDCPTATTALASSGFPSEQIIEQANLSSSSSLKC